jgi:hypothetical protein
MYPLKNWLAYPRGYKFGQKTFYSDFHLGLDIVCPLNTEIIAWEDLTVSNAFFGTQGGNTIWVKTDGKLFRFMHLSKPGKTGTYKKGEVIGYTGNTGTSTAPHLHVDISKNGTLEINNHSNFIDPEEYFKQINDNNMELTKDQKKELAKLGFDFGDNLNSSELDKLIKKAVDLQEEPDPVCPPSENCDVYKQEIEDLKAQAVVDNKRIKELEPKADIGNRFIETSKMANNFVE